MLARGEGVAIILLCQRIAHFSGTVHLIDLRPVLKLVFVRIGPVEKKTESFVPFQLLWSDKVKKTFFKKDHLEFCLMLPKLPIFQKDLKGSA